MKIKILSSLKIICVLLLSLCVSALCNKFFFIDNTSKIRSHPEQYIASEISSYFNKTTRKTDSQTTTVIANVQEFKDVLEKIKDEPMKRIAKGTYAQSYNGKTVTTINLGEIPYKQYSYVVKGKTITIRVPDTDKPPTQKDVEALVSQTENK